MTSIFDRYDGEFVNITSQIRSNISENQSFGLTQGLLKQADDLLKQMNIEARGSGDENSKDKIKTYKKTIAALKRDFQEASDKQNRGDLFAGGNNSGQDRMINTQDKVSERREGKE